MNNKTKLIWVGSRQSDITDADIYSGSITLYGSGKDGNVSISAKYGEWPDNNNCSNRHDGFLAAEMRIAAQDSDVRFMMYNPAWADEIEGIEDLRDRIICCNSYDLITEINDKIATYRRLKKMMPVLRAEVLSFNKISYDSLCSRFGVKGGSFFVQAPFASGGFGSFILNRRNEKRLLREMDRKKKYLVSVFAENSVPVNVNAVIFDDGAVLYPGSMQILRKGADRMLYRGSDYIGYRGIPEDKRKLFESRALALCEDMRQRGYRGICGVDGMIVGSEVYLNEVNTRFQSSTPLVNTALKRSGLPTVNEAAIAAFEGASVSDYAMCADVEVSFSAYNYTSGVCPKHAVRALEAAERDPDCVRVDMDGFRPGMRAGKNVYMFRIVFGANIAAVSPDNSVFFHENVVEPDPYIYRRVLEQDRLAVKLAVMTQGVDIEPDAVAYLESHGGIRPGNNNAVDIDAYGIIINAPRDVRFIRFSPFTIRLNSQEKLELYYYDKYLTEIKLFPLDPLSLKVTKAHGIPYESIAYLSTDRLRVHTTNTCIFKAQCRSCKFCNITPQEGIIPIEDIREVIYDYVENSPAVRHFLIGGQSAEEANVRSRICDVAKIIREKTDKSIYVMALPYEKPVIKELCDTGINELACNTEIYDDAIARDIMPGKGRLPRARYIDILSYATEMLGKKGEVKTAFIVGLEPHASLMKGIRAFAERNIEIVLSVFRPLPETPLENLMAPPLKYLYRLYYLAERISEKHGLRLGPSCVCCQNNTLSLPDD